jgi:hypothetical protein
VQGKQKWYLQDGPNSTALTRCSLLDTLLIQSNSQTVTVTSQQGNLVNMLQSTRRAEVFESGRGTDPTS